MTTEDSSAHARASFRASADAFIATVEQITPDDLSRPGLGSWSVLELLAHATRAFLTIRQMLAAGAGGTPPEGSGLLAAPADYFRALPDDPSVHEQIAQRGVDTVAALGPDPITGAVLIAREVLTQVEVTPDDALIVHSSGYADFIVYLPTRTLELVVHTLDLQRATGQEFRVDPVALQDTLHMLVDTADRADPVALLLALTGRQQLPASFNILG
jgi:uncharacterized protein (TIGR03083 family)